MKRGSFLFFLMRSLSQRKGRLVIASASVTLAVAVLIGLIALTAGIREKLGTEIKAYGANLIVYAGDGGFMNESILSKLSAVEHVEDAAGQIFGKAFIRGQAIEVVGADIDKLKERGWRLQGMWPSKKGEALAGVNLKEALKLRAGSAIRLEEGEGKSVDHDYTVTGFIEMGGPEDNELIMTLPDAAQFLSAEGRLSSVLLRGRPGELDRIAQAIRNSYPTLGVKTVRSVAFAEESLLAKIQLLMVLVSLVVLFAAAVTVGATIGANVLERRQEIGLMKALGGTKKEISLFYITEAAFIGILGGFGGLIFGSLSAEAVSKGAFHSFISVPLSLVFVSPVIGVILAVSAAHVPVKQALGSNPALVLRGE